MAASVNDMEVSGEILGGQISFIKKKIIKKMFQIANENALLGQNNSNLMSKKINLDSRMFTEAAMMSTDFSVVFRV